MAPLDRPVVAVEGDISRASPRRADPSPGSPSASISARRTEYPNPRSCRSARQSDADRCTIPRVNNAASWVRHKELAA